MVIPKIKNTDKGIRDDWWGEGHFFGERYFYPDNSKDGYLLNQKETLKERTARESEGVVNLLELNKGSTILDMPCGYGRHSIALSAMGYQATGLDIDREHLKKARGDALEKNISVNFLERDIRNIGKDLGGKYDAVINMFYSFGFFKPEKENIQVMREFYRSLKPGGRLLLHTDVSPEMIANKTTIKESIRNLENNNRLIILENYNPETKRMEGSWETTNAIGHVIFPRAFYSMRLYSADEFIGMAKDVGFKDAEVYGSFRGERFDKKSEEMIMVAAK